MPPPTLPGLQLATLVDHAPEGDGWLHEQKFDGYRILGVMDEGGVRLWSRNAIEWTSRLPDIAAAIGQLGARRLVLDGEVAVVGPDGHTSFQAMQRMLNGEAAPTFFLFDLLQLDKDDLRGLPLEQRKERLRTLLAGASDVLRYSEHVVGRGAEFYRLACEGGLEGIVSKKRSATYRAGRGGDWVKIKCLHRQEMVIGGFTEPSGARQGVGALIVGYHDGERLAYAGKVGTGFDARTLIDLRRRFDPLITETCPFDPQPRRTWIGAGAHWLVPALVCEVAFSEWTGDGRLRHPSFQGLRLDKQADDVFRETEHHVR